MENDVDQDDGLVTLVLLIEKIRFNRTGTITGHVLVPRPRTTPHSVNS